MAEQVRTVTVKIEVDTNKQTFVFDRDDLTLDEVGEVVEEFLTDLKDRL